LLLPTLDAEGRKSASAFLASLTTTSYRVSQKLRLARQLLKQFKRELNPEQLALQAAYSRGEVFDLSTTRRTVRKLIT
jgi:hypothetical protein